MKSIKPRRVNTCYSIIVQICVFFRNTIMNPRLFLLFLLIGASVACRSSSVDCEWTSWGIAECSVTCGTGTRIKTRTKHVEESNGGTCNGKTTETEECHNEEGSGCGDGKRFT